MIATAEFERDSLEMENDFPVEFTLGVLRFTGSKDESQVGLTMSNPGYNARRRTRLVCRISQFNGTLPVTNDLITMEDLLWRVDEAPEYSPDGINITLPLVQST